MRSVSIAWVLAAGPAAPELLVAAAGPLDDVDGDPGPLEFIAAASQKFKFFKMLKIFEKIAIP